jgi:hypothetical protein
MAEKIQDSVLRFLDSYALKLKEYADKRNAGYDDYARLSARRELRDMGLQPAMIEYLVIRGSELDKEYKKH